MARLFTCGFEFGELIEHNGTVASSVATSSVQTTIVRTGVYALYISGIDGSSDYYYFVQTLAGNPQEIYIRIAFYYPNGTVTTIYQPILNLTDAADNNHLTLALTTNNSFLSVYRGGTGAMGKTGGTLLATGTNALTGNTWYVIEMRALISNTVGVATIRVNGVNDINFSGDTAASASEFVNTVQFGSCSAGGGIGFIAAYFDDLAINDTAGSNENSWPGLGGVYLLRPASEGTAITWTPSTGSTHYTLVDEVPKNTTDYVSSSAASAIDQYTLTSLCSAINTINFIEPTFQAALGAAGSAGVFPLVRHSSANYESASVIVAQATPNYILFKGPPIYTVLGGAGAWTPAQVNALEVGIKIK